jgi:hypothetical protein
VPLGREHELRGLEQEAGNLDRGVDDSARIVAQVEDEPRGAFLLQPLQVAANLVTGGVGEVGDADVGDVRADQEGVAYRVARNAPALDFELERLLESDALDRHTHRSALGAAQFLGDLVEIELGGRRSIDLRDDVAGAEADARGRGAVDRRDHGDATAPERDDHTDPVERALMALAHAGERLGAQEAGMRVERGQRSVQTGRNQVLGRHRQGCVLEQRAQGGGVAPEERIGVVRTARGALARRRTGQRAERDHADRHSEP